MRTNVTRQFRSRERNVHYVVVSFPGTKVHGNETSRYQYIYCYQIRANQLRTKANWSVWDDDEYTAPHCAYAAQNVWTNDMKQPETETRRFGPRPRRGPRRIGPRRDIVTSRDCLETETTSLEYYKNYTREHAGLRRRRARVQIAVATLSGNSLRQLFTPIVPLFTKQHNWQQPSYGLRG